MNASGHAHSALQNRVAQLVLLYRIGAQSLLAPELGTPRSPNSSNR